ncbi:hypothetical protein ROSI111154_24095 [Rouxiella silvae]
MAYLYIVTIIMIWVSWFVQLRYVYRLKEMKETRSWYDLPRKSCSEDKEVTLNRRLKNEKKNLSRVLRIAVILTLISLIGLSSLII